MLVLLQSRSQRGRTPTPGWYCGLKRIPAIWSHTYNPCRTLGSCFLAATGEFIKLLSLWQDTWLLSLLLWKGSILLSVIQQVQVTISLLLLFLFWAISSQQVWSIIIFFICLQILFKIPRCFTILPALSLFNFVRCFSKGEKKLEEELVSRHFSEAKGAIAFLTIFLPGSGAYLRIQCISPWQRRCYHGGFLPCWGYHWAFLVGWGEEPLEHGFC